MDDTARTPGAALGEVLMVVCARVVDDGTFLLA